MLKEKSYQRHLIMAKSDHIIKEILNEGYSDLDFKTSSTKEICLETQIENKFEALSLENLYSNLKSSSSNVEAIAKLYMDFYFLTDCETKDFIRSNLVMFIMRGLPGSGKSTIVRNIREVFGAGDSNNFEICSADHYFIRNDNSYKFDAKKLKDAHSYCQEIAKHSVKQRKSIIIIDNNNIKRWEMQPYHRMANQGGYLVILIEPKTPWRLNPIILTEKNCHNVTNDVLVKKVEEYSSVFPLYYGWFLGRSESRKLRYGGKKLLKSIVENCEKFRTDFKELSSSMSNPNYTDYSLPYNFEYSKKSCVTNDHSLLHCTSKYCGNLRSGKYDDVLNYSSRADIKDSLGTVSKLKVSGFVISEKTFSATVALDEKQLQLFEKSSYDKGSRAHITLAITDDASPVQAGLDTLEVFELEKKNKNQLKGDYYIYKIPRTTYILKQFREGLWSVNTSSKELMFNALFTGYYS